MSHKTAYSQPVSTKGELLFEKQPARKAAKGQLLLAMDSFDDYQIQDLSVLITIRLDILFSSSNIPQPFLDPKIMVQRKAQQKH